MNSRLPSSTNGVDCTDPQAQDVQFYEPTIPAFVGPELDRLYAARSSTLTHLKVFKHVRQAHTYVRRENGVAVAILLFGLNKNIVEVFNESISVPVKEIDYFAEAVFSYFQHVSVIMFHAIEAEGTSRRYMCRMAYCKTDMLITAPVDKGSYMDGLGRRTRESIRRKQKSLQANFPSLEIRILKKTDITRDLVARIIDFNRKRLHAKRQWSGDDESEIDRITAMCQQYGVVIFATINGQVCGGTINYEIGNSFAFRATGHDPVFDKHSLGFVICYLTFQHAIENGARQIHLGSGTQKYKSMLGGHKRDLHDLVVFRSTAHFLLNPDLIITSIVRDRLLRMKRAITEAERSNAGVSSLMAHHFIAATRTIRWLRHSWH